MYPARKDSGSFKDILLLARRDHISHHIISPLLHVHKSSPILPALPNTPSLDATVLFSIIFATNFASRYGGTGGLLLTPEITSPASDTLSSAPLHPQRGQ